VSGTTNGATSKPYRACFKFVRQTAAQNHWSAQYHSFGFHIDLDFGEFDPHIYDQNRRLYLNSVSFITTATFRVKSLINKERSTCHRKQYLIGCLHISMLIKYNGDIVSWQLTINYATRASACSYRQRALMWSHSYKLTLPFIRLPDVG